MGVSSTWLARITTNEALRRLAMRRVTADVIELGEEVEVSYGAVVPSTPNPEQVAARAEIRRMVEHALDALAAP